VEVNRLRSGEDGIRVHLKTKKGVLIYFCFECEICLLLHLGFRRDFEAGFDYVHY